MSTLRKTCWTCGERYTVRMGTDGAGRLIEQPEPCACKREEQRAAAAVLRPLEEGETYEDRAKLARKTGICMDCYAPVEGTVGLALRCAPHKAEAHRVANRRSIERTRAARRQRESERWHNDPEFRARKMAQKRERHRRRMQTDPDYRARERQRRQNEILAARMGPKKRAKHLEYQRQYNEGRREEKLEYMKRYNVYPDDYTPDCLECGGAIPWSGRGRPATYHHWCAPYRSQAARRRAREEHQAAQRHEAGRAA